MNGIETIVCILVAGLTFMVTVCGIIICVSNMLDRKMKTKTDLQLKVFDREMQEFGKIVESVCGAISKAVESRKIAKEEEIKNKVMATKQDGFGII